MFVAVLFTWRNPWQSAPSPQRIGQSRTGRPHASVPGCRCAARRTASPPIWDQLSRFPEPSREHRTDDRQQMASLRHDRQTHAR